MTPRLQACWQSLTKAFQRVEIFFDKTIPAYIKDHIAGVLAVVEGIEKLIENPVLDGILDAIAPRVMPEVLASITKFFKQAVIDLEIIQALPDGLTLEEMLKAVSDQLAPKSPALRVALLHALSVNLTKLSSGDTVLTDTELNTLVAFKANQVNHAANMPSA